MDIVKLEEKKMNFHETLCHEIWDNEKLRPIVRRKLLSIAKAFVEYLNVDITFKDIIITGSIANYNYTDESDIDLHIICNLEDWGISLEFLSDYFNAKKSLFNQKYDITIYKHPVEVYVENANTPAVATGKYSIIKNKWLIKPQKISFEVEDIRNNPKYKQLLNSIREIFKGEFILEDAEQILNKIYEIRKEGLKEGGEFSEGNLIFKRLRNTGKIEKLKKAINKNYSEELSLSEMIEALKKGE